MKQFLIFTILFLFSIWASAQDNEYNLIDKEIKYEFITDMSVGKMKYFDDYDNDYEAGFKNRIVITRFEIVEKIYLEKIIVDVEGIPGKVEWSKRVEIKPLIEKYITNREQIIFSNIIWKSYNEFEFTLNGIAFNGVLLNDSKVKIEKRHD